ncbi:hypothetical protein V1634_13170 [Plantactinospora veratri]|uniref:Uncharacterized protein n=1 Tax=Plantactinospora veratri TaxID=1436122 RepID=A0ABU7SCW2_9ACTN
MAAGAKGGGGQRQSANARWAAAGRAKAAERTAKRLKITLVVAVCLVVTGGFVVGALSSGDDSTVVAPPEPAERTDTVTLLRQAHATQQICYGWRLRSGGASYGAAPVSVGSNLGDNVAVDSDPARCPRWVEIDASVWYTSASSESSDSASYLVTSSSDFAHVDFDRGLRRLGVDPDQFVDDPGRAVCQAAVFLPLLVSEAGAGSAARATPPAAAGAAPSPLPDSGNDFWRDRWVFLLGAAGLFLLTALFLAIGVFERRHQNPSPVQPAAGRGLSADSVVAPGNGRRGSGRRR